MSHDTDKLIRQLSLVAYLMAERRPLTARDIKSSVEGYSEMSDEAFARRFYSDRAELIALGVPLSSQRDEFTGEELYSLRSERYFLPKLELGDDELAALLTALHLLEGQFAYAEPLRLALQNLALGRPNPSEDVARDVSLSLTGTGYTSDVAARLQKLEAAVSKQRTVLFRYWSISTDEEAQRTLDPYSLYFLEGQWYVVGRDRDRDAIRTFRLSRIRGDVRFATRRERDFRTPSEFDATAWRDRVSWQLTDGGETAVIWVAPDDAWQVERRVGRHGSLQFQDDRSALYTTQYADSRALIQWMLDRNGRAIPLSPPELRDEMAAALERVRELHEGPPPPHAAPIRMVRETAPPPEKVESPVAPERFAVLQAMMAQLLAACGEQSRTRIAAKDLKERFHLDDDGLDRHLQLLNLVNFGGGCYALYAELQDDGETIDVEKELYGDEFRRPARLSPLEAKALLLALDLVGPLVAADAHTSLPAVRAKVEEAFGQYETRDVAVPPASAVDEDVLSVLQEAIRFRRLVEIEYLSRAGDAVTKREVEPHRLRGLRGEWYCDTYDRTNDGERTFRVDRIRSAAMLAETFERRPGLGERSGSEELSGKVGRASVWFSPRIARWELEKRDDTAELADGAAVATITYGEERFLAGELCRQLGEAVLLEPEPLRALVAERAGELLALLRQHAEAYAARR